MEGAESVFRLETLHFSCSVGVCWGLHIFVVLWVNVPRLFPSCRILIVPDRVVGNGLGAQGLVNASINLLDVVDEFGVNACNRS